MSLTTDVCWYLERREVFQYAVTVPLSGGVGGTNRDKVKGIPLPGPRKRTWPSHPCRSSWAQSKGRAVGPVSVLLFHPNIRQLSGARDTKWGTEQEDTLSMYAVLGGVSRQRCERGYDGRAPLRPYGVLRAVRLAHSEAPPPTPAG